VRRTPVDPKDVLDLATIGMEHMVNGATAWNEWCQRVMADVGDLVKWMAESTGQSRDDLLREIHGYGVAAVKDFGYEVESAPPQAQVQLEKPP